MKTKILISGFFFLLFNSLAIAQSDYETLQKFKNEYKNIETSIKNDSTSDQFSLIEESIHNLKNDFISNKEFLDKSLYPDNFQSALDKLGNTFESKKNDLTQITSLTTQVGTLHSEVAELNNKNEDLLKQITDLQMQTNKNQESITKLNTLIAQLRTNLNKRDLLVRDLVDNLLSQFIKLPANMSHNESQSIVSKVNKENLFYNIERTIDDNIQFLKVTRLSADDNSKIIEQYQGFNKIWNQVGPRLSSVYLTINQKKSEISQIDSLFQGWNNEINAEIWKNIQNDFSAKNIIIADFNDANGFVTNTVGFIDNEIKNIGVKSKDESEAVFHTFMDSVYYKTVANKWIPLLMNNQMLSQNQKDVIEAKIDAWQKEYVPSIPFWPFVIGGILVLFLIIYLYKKMQRTPQNVKLNLSKQ